MLSPAEVLRRYLSDLGLIVLPSNGSVIGDWWCYVSMMPTKGDRAVIIQDTAGMVSDRCRPRPGVPKTTHPGVQIRLRSPDYGSGFKKGVELANALDDVANTVVIISNSESYKIQVVTRTTDTVPLGEETDTKRNLFSINARVVILS